MLVISIPIFIINFFYTYEIKEIVSGFYTNKKEETKINIRVLKEDNTVEQIDLEEYLIGVVSSEVPVYFEEEALKAQAVASRTYALKQMENNKNESYDVTDNILSQVYSTNEELKNKWKENYDEYYNKIKNIVNKTKGEYLSYNDDYIYAFFFSTSNGFTEDNINVFGADLPYLKVVDSSFDEKETPNFLVTASFSKEEFYNLLGISYSNNLKITNIETTSSNRIYSLEVNGNYFKGRDFQKKLSLRSNDFTIEEKENEIIITTKGYGHGVGLSQYGANALAKKNKTYQEILKYYYQGVEIKKL
jgi:stage II sporulation protein D